MFANDVLRKKAASHVVDASLTWERSLASPAHESMLVGSFWSAYLPNGRSPTGRQIPDALFNTAQDLYPSHGVLRSIILTISLTAAGNRNDDVTLKIEGARRYTETLHATAAALSSSPKSQGNGLLVAVRFLSLYEVSLQQTYTQWPLGC